jgi:hypothetical protein
MKEYQNTWRPIACSVLLIGLLLASGQATALQQEGAPPVDWGSPSDQPQPAPDPDSFEIPSAPAPQAPPQPAPQTAPQPAPAPQPAAAQPAPQRRVAYSGLRNEADISTTDVEFLESIVLEALIPLSGRGFDIGPDDNASKFCDDSCAINLARQAGRELIVHGSIGTYLGGYTVTLKLHRVFDGQLLHSSTTESRTALGELVAPTKDAAVILTTVIETSLPAPLPTPALPPPQPIPPPPPPPADTTYWWPTEETTAEADDEPEEEGGFPYPTRGLELEIRGGFNFCGEAGDAKCNNYKMGGGGGAFIGVRLAPVFSVGIDFGVYGLKLKDTDGASNVQVSTRNFMLNPRLYLPFRIAEIYLELGFLFFGLYEQGEISGEEYQIKISSFASFRLGAGVTIYIVRGSRAGDIGLGLDLDYNFFAPKDVELCGKPVAEGNDCDEMSWGTYVSWLSDLASEETGDDIDYTHDMVDFLQFSAHLTWLIPIF